MSNSPPFSITGQKPCHEADVIRLHQAALGPGRFAKTVYRLREEAKPAEELCFVAHQGARLIGAVTLCHIYIGEEKALLLGPLAVLPAQKRKGAGQLLMNRALSQARQSGHRLILLVGDMPYYARFGFAPAPKGMIHLPGPVDPQRLLVCLLQKGDCLQANGLVRGVKTP